MNRRNSWTRGLAVSALLCVAPAALGQTPPDAGQTRTPIPARVVRGGGANVMPMTPEERTAIERQGKLEDSAAKALDAGRPADAEADAREALRSRRTDSGKGWEILAEALDAQGKDQEALQVYGRMVGQGDDSVHVRLPYALLLLKAGQWAPALAAYDKALPSVTVEPGPLRANSRFSPDAPEPAALATAIHIALALTQFNLSSWGGHVQNDTAMAHLRAALALSPGSGLANYYYGYGWGQLGPAERAKLGGFEQARAALMTAVRRGRGPVKAAAARALRKMAAKTDTKKPT